MGEVASGLPTLTSSAMVDKRTIAEVVVEQARAHLESDEGRRELREIIEKFHEFTKKLKEASRVDPSVLREMITEIAKLQVEISARLQYESFLRSCIRSGEKTEMTFDEFVRQGVRGRGTSWVG